MHIEDVWPGQIVVVGPNLASLHKPDHAERSWRGRVLRVYERSVDVEPLDGGLPRNVLPERLS